MNHSVRSALTAGLVALCATPAGAQTSTSLLGTDPRATYQALKIVQDALYKPADHIARGRKGASFDLDDCSDEVSDFEPQPVESETDATNTPAVSPTSAEETSAPDTEDGPQLLDYERLAYNVTRWSRALKALGYPESVWQPAIDRYEADTLAVLRTPAKPAGESESEDSASALDRIETAATSQLVKRLAAYRRSHPQPRLGQVVAEGGCGGESSAVKIASQPRGATVLFIPLFFYKLCQAQKLDPEDTSHCDRWREVLDGVANYMSGDYAYIARWPDGVTRHGRLTMGEKEDGKTVTLAKPAH